MPKLRPPGSRHLNQTGHAILHREPIGRSAAAWTRVDEVAVHALHGGPHDEALFHVPLCFNQRQEIARAVATRGA